MFAEIITIGDEILIGQIVDTNSAFIGKALNDIGVSVYQITSIQDDKQHILKALAEAENNADIIIITGGLGPTKDDITKHTLADYFEDSFVKNEAVLEHVEELFKTYTKTPISDLNRKQALVPSKAKVLHNALGTAPGMWFEKGSKVFVSLPGVPYEMKALITNEVLPKIQEKYKRPHIVHKTLLTYGLGESAIANRIEIWEEQLPEYIKLAYLPSAGKVRLRLTGKGQDLEQLTKEVDNQIKNVLPLIEDIFVGYELMGQSIEGIIAEQLKAKGYTLALAESCTGGKIAEQFTQHSGASAFFKGGLVAYNTTIKETILGVPKSVIDEFSVVSAPVAEAMASQAMKIFDADFAVATTGNAGPTKGDSDAEIGTVFIAIATKDKVFSEVFKFGSNRARVVTKTVNKALELLQKEI